MHKGPLADIAGIVCTHDGAARRNDALRGFRQLHIFAKRGAVERNIGATVWCYIWDDGVAAIVGRNGVVVSQSDVIQPRRFNQYRCVGDVLTQSDAIGMSNDTAVGAVVNALAAAIIAVASVDAAAGTVIGRPHIAAVVFPVAVPLLQTPLQAIVLQRITTDGNRLIG